MPNKLTKFIIAIAVQLVIILAIIVFKVSVLTGGTEVFLKIAPIDPRDLLRGDYVTFRYDISTIKPYQLLDQVNNGDTVYVLLKPAGQYWTVKNVKRTKPADNSIFIKATVMSGGSDERPTYHHTYHQNLTVKYGIEEYFVPEGEGRNVSFWRKEVYAKVKVDDDGNAVLTQLYVDGKPWP